MRRVVQIVFVASILATACSSAPDPEVGSPPPDGTEEPALPPQLSPENVAITGAEQRGYRRPWLTQDPSNPENLAVAYEDGNSPSACYLSLSTDGGSTWESLAVIGQDGVFPFPEGYDRCQRPAASYAPGGILHVVVSVLQPSNTFPPPAIILAMTTLDGGENFSEPIRVEQQAEGVSDLNVALATASNGQLNLAWQANVPPPPSIATSRSADGGTTFSPALAVSPTGAGASRASIAVGPDGTVFVVYIDSAGFRSSQGEDPMEARVVSSNGEAVSFGEPVTALDLSSCFTPDNACQQDPQGNSSFNPSVGIATGPTPGQLVVVGAGLGPEEEFRLSFAASSDGGKTWRQTEQLGLPVAGGGDHHQLVPSVAVAPNGRIDVVYYDLQEPSGLQDTFLISSADGGMSFSPPRRISDVPSDTAVRGSSSFGNDPFSAGSLVASTNESAYVVWTDSRRGTLESAKRDVFFAQANA